LPDFVFYILVRSSDNISAYIQENEDPGLLKMPSISRLIFYFGFMGSWLSWNEGSLILELITYLSYKFLVVFH
jgi:hypothetical protein